MNKKDFIDNLNKVTLELDSPILFHRTKIDNLKSILADGALLPLESREVHNYNYGYDLSEKRNSKKSTYEKYLQSVFVGFKPISYKIKSREMFGILEEIEKENVVFIIDPYNLKEEVLQSSFLCIDWHYGKFYNSDCKKWNLKKDEEDNMKRWEKFLIRKLNKYNQKYLINEVVIRNPEGINFREILSVNPKGVMIVVNMKKVSDEVKNLVEQYPEYQWVFVN